LKGRELAITITPNVGRALMPTDAIKLSTQHFSTAVDFLLKPTRFAAHHEDRNEYAHPYAFLVSNITLSVTAYFAAERVFQANSTGQFTRVHATLIFAGVALLHCVLAVVVGEVAGWLLNEHTEPFALFRAFCYTTIFYPCIAIALAAPSAGVFGEPAATLVLSMSVIQVAAALYLLSTAARFSYLYGRRLLAFVAVACALLTITTFALAVAYTIVSPENYEKTQPANRTPPRVHYQSTEVGSLLGGVTLESRELGPYAAQLVGAPIGATTREWFDFGPDINMKYSVNAKDGVGRVNGLQPRRTYYFRYVAQHGNTTCYGEMKSFTTWAP
jgi:hypothetical protein